MSKRKAYYTRKMKKAVHLLFFHKHRKPGVKGWELKKGLGSDYPKVLKILNKHLEIFDLKVNTVFEGEIPSGEPTLNQLDKARFYITLKGELEPDETKMIGWRIDDLAGLAITIGHIISKRGKAPRKEVEELLREKLPEWRVGMNLDQYIRYGYLMEDENGQLYLDWRTNAEVDQKEFMDLILRAES